MTESDPDPLRATPYRILACIGKGGMGTVYDVEHEHLGKRFVVKVLSEEVARDPSLVDRMRVEAAILGRLQHPNVVQVYHFDWTSNGRPYLVMERLIGNTLGVELRRRGPLPFEEAISYVCQALSGLGVAHAAGVVHRDIKLDNLFLHEPLEGEARVAGEPRIVKVLDFGVAKVLEAAQNRGIAPPSLPTTEGAVVGTPRYLSPEQARGEPIDHRSDLYAIGMVLYILLTGRGPWEGYRSLGELVRALTDVEPQPPSAYAPSRLPQQLDRVVLKALAKRPEDRYQSAHEFFAALRSVLERRDSNGGRSVAPAIAEQAASGVTATLDIGPALATTAQDPWWSAPSQAGEGHGEASEGGESQVAAHASTATEPLVKRSAGQRSVATPRALGTRPEGAARRAVAFAPTTPVDVGAARALQSAPYIADQLPTRTSPPTPPVMPEGARIPQQSLRYSSGPRPLRLPTKITPQAIFIALIVVTALAVGMLVMLLPRLLP